MKNKKGYMFILDVAIAIVILIIGITTIYYKHYSSNKAIYVTEQLSEDVLGVLANTKISDICQNPSDLVGCKCQNYAKMQEIVCANPKLVNDFDSSILDMISELIQTSSIDGQQIKDLIKEIFVDKKVIDEKRFGFAILYTDSSSTPLEIYNTENY